MDVSKESEGKEMGGGRGRMGEEEGIKRDEPGFNLDLENEERDLLDVDDQELSEYSQDLERAGSYP